jgi:uncharacterized protein YjbJ (UPF0337 family)
MDKNRLDGAVERAKGSIKEAIGKVTGDDKLEIEGIADKRAGKARIAVGKVKDAAREALKR